MSADPVAELLGDPRFKGKPITWGVTPESYDAMRRSTSVAVKLYPMRRLELWNSVAS